MARVVTSISASAGCSGLPFNHSCYRNSPFALFVKPYITSKEMTFEAVDVNHRLGYLQLDQNDSFYSIIHGNLANVTAEVISISAERGSLYNFTRPIFFNKFHALVTKNRQVSPNSFSTLLREFSLGVWLIVLASVFSVLFLRGFIGPRLAGLGLPSSAVLPRWPRFLAAAILGGCSVLYAAKVTASVASTTLSFEPTILGLAEEIRSGRMQMIATSLTGYLFERINQSNFPELASLRRAIEINPPILVNNLDTACRMVATATEKPMIYFEYRFYAYIYCSSYVCDMDIVPLTDSLLIMSSFVVGSNQFALKRKIEELTKRGIIQADYNRLISSRSTCFGTSTSDTASFAAFKPKSLQPEPNNVDFVDFHDELGWLFYLYAICLALAFATLIVELLHAGLKKRNCAILK